MTQDESPIPDHAERSRFGPFLVLSSLVAALVSGAFFCPRFVYWGGLGLPDPPRVPELFRAVSTLPQLADPFTPIEKTVNAVIRWRLLFPMAAHLLHLPRGVFLALPFLGSLLVLGTAARLVLRETGRRLPSLLAATLVATGNWYFVSTGWLAYFDSWLVLGLLLATFVRSRAIVLAVCLLTPWVDERFLLALPVVLLVRAAHFGQLEAGKGRAIFRDAGVCLLGALPYLGVRLFATLTGRDPATTDYVSTHLAQIPGTAGWRLWGAWEGWRAGWMFAIAFFAGSLGGAGRGRRAALVALTVVTLAGSLLAAGDYSRGVVMAAPLVLAGMLGAQRERPGIARWLLPSALALNLVLPASHVIITFSVPVRNVVYEAKQWRDPPPGVDPELYLSRGLERFEAGNLAGAGRDLDSVLVLDPSHTGARFARASLRARVGDLAGAAVDLRRNLELAAPDWPQRALALELLERVERAQREGTGPSPDGAGPN